MGWGLFALQPTRAGDELLPFVGRTYLKAKFKTMQALSPRFIRYVLKAEADVYQDGDVEHGNVAGFINSSIGRSHISNVFWEYSTLPRPWNTEDGDTQGQLLRGTYLLERSCLHIIPLICKYRVGGNTGIP